MSVCPVRVRYTGNCSFKDTVWAEEKNWLSSSKDKKSISVSSSGCVVSSWVAASPCASGSGVSFCSRSLEGRKMATNRRKSIRRMDRISFNLLISAPLFLLENPILRGSRMDFRHHVKCTVHVVLGVVIIGIVYQHLPVRSQPPKDDKMPPGRE